MHETRIYKKSEAIVFCNTKEKYGGLSNMAGGFPLRINNRTIWNTEALYQSLKFTGQADIQELIIINDYPLSRPK